MKSEPKNLVVPATKPRATEEKHLTFRVLVAYEDPAAGSQAKKVFDHLRRQAPKNAEYSQATWKFNLLQYEKLKEMAARDAAAADMLIVAMTADGDVPEEVKAWIARWVGQRLEPRAALLMISDPQAGARFTANPPPSPTAGLQMRN